MEVTFNFLGFISSRILEIDPRSGNGEIFAVIFILGLFYAIPTTIILFVWLIRLIRKTIIIRKEMRVRGVKKAVYCEEACCLGCKNTFESRQVDLNKWYYDRSLYPMKCRQCRNEDSIAYFEGRKCEGCGIDIAVFGDESFCTNCIKKGFQRKQIKQIK